MIAISSQEQVNPTDTGVIERLCLFARVDTTQMILWKSQVPLENAKVLRCQVDHLNDSSLHLIYWQDDFMRFGYASRFCS